MKYRVCLMVLGLIMVLFSYSFSQVPQLINYQGKLTKTTGAPLDTTVQMIFSIYADSNGTILNWTETQVAVKVEKGVFNVLLGSVNPIPSSVFNGGIRYLGVKVGGDPEITPRKPMVSVPYAYRAGSIQTNCHDCDSLFVNVLGPDSVVSTSGVAFLGKATGSSSSGMYGMHGYADNTSTGQAYGGYFETSSSGTGTHYGVYGSASSASSASVFGGAFNVNSAGTGFHYGTYSAAYGNSSGNSYGVYGYGSNSSTGDVIGGYFQTSSSGTGTHYGGYASASGSSASPTYGHYGNANNSSTGSAYGGYFQTSSSGTGTHYGGYASASGSSASSTYGHYGNANNSSTGSAYGGYFVTSDSGTGLHYGVMAEGDGNSSNSTYGVYGLAENTSNGYAYGGYFDASSAGTGGYHYGVYANAYCNSNYVSLGVEGWATNYSSGNAIGGYFNATSDGTGYKYGIMAIAPPSQGYGVYCGGDMIVTGTKSAAVKVNNGQYRQLYCQESPENWFEDFGGGRLQNGITTIQLEPLFVQTVNTQIEYRVYLTPEGDCKGLYVTNKTTNSFEVRELQGGNSNIPFSYRIVAKRKGYENTRLAKMAGSTPEEMALEQSKHQAGMEKERASRDKEREKVAEEKVKMEKMEER